MTNFDCDFQAAIAGKVKCNLLGVALGDSWISPVESMLSWPPFLYATVNITMKLIFQNKVIDANSRFMLQMEPLKLLKMLIKM